jgi:hypothetical protein
MEAALGATQAVLVVMRAQIHQVLVPQILVHMGAAVKAVRLIQVLTVNTVVPRAQRVKALQVRIQEAQLRLDLVLLQHMVSNYRLLHYEDPSSLSIALHFPTLNPYEDFILTPQTGGGRYYGGGATTPYTAGSRSPLGIAAVPLALGVAALAVYPGLWIYGAYAYPYSHPYTFYNRTASANSTNSTNTRRDILDEYPTLLIRQSEDTGVNETKPVTCLCAMYAECGCDDNGNTTFLDSIIGDGTYSNLNLSLVNVADINGTSTIVLNGTLPNGTTASGGTDNANAAAKSVVEGAGYWVMVAIVGATVYMV